MKNFGKFETAWEIELAVAKHFGIRDCVIVPNVSWGFLPYEADLLILNSSDYAYEVEIKVSRGDLIRDKEKRHSHNCNKIRKLWFAVPEKLMHCLEFVPAKAGILIVGIAGQVREHKPPEINKGCLKLTADEKFTVARLGALRLWPLKERVYRSTLSRLKR